MRSQALERAQRRIVWLRFFGVGLVLVLAGRAAHLTVAHTRARDLYTDQIQTEQRLAPARGTISDRAGRALALTTEAHSVYVLPRLLEDRPAAAHALADALGQDPDRMRRRLAERESFTYVARWVEAEAAERVRALELRGVGIDREPRRTYPAGKLAAPLLGFANIDGRGVRGIEQLEDRWLTGRPRRVQVERDARGRALALRSSDPRTTQGGELRLTIDAALQGAAEAALTESIETFEARGGFVIVLDPANGDVLGLAEAPGFDPNHFRELDYFETRARTFVDVMEAGSTMKAFLVASALEAGAIDDASAFDTGEGFMRVPGKTIRDAKPWGVIGVADVLRVSSNVGAVQIAQLLGREAQHAGLLRFGFGRPTGSGFPMEAAGLLRDWARWRPVDQATVAFGQGLSVTAIQLASALAALAHDGERMRPRLVHSRRRDEGAWKPTPIESLGHAVSPAVARRTLEMMGTVVSPEGTGRLAGLRGVSVAGKTGTAQKFDRELGSYSQDRYIAWFMGAVPADDPQFAIVVAVDEPMGKLHSGGTVAAPLFARVAAAALARRGIVTRPEPIPRPLPETRLVEAPAAPDATPAPVEYSAPAPQPADALQAAESVTEIVAEPLSDDFETGPQFAAMAAPPARPAVRSRAAGPVSPVPMPALEPRFVPDFSGQPLSHALRIARSETLVLDVQGATEGRVVSQIPVPGTVLSGSNRTVRVRLAPWAEGG